MAELALGLTKTAVEGTLSRVKSAIDEEAKLKLRVQNDLVFIIGEFQMMQSFLNVASKERANNEVVRTWVRQLRELAFDVEDCVEFVVHLDSRSAWTWLWRVVPSCIAPPLPLDVAVAQIQLLKARVEDVSQRNTRYHLISDSGSSSGSSSSKQHVVSCSSASPATTRAATAFRILNEVWEAAGKHRGIGDLKTLITDEGNDLAVISVWGSAGAVDLEAAYIIREAYNDPDICQHFKSRAWVKLMHPFNPDEFHKSLLTQFYATSHKTNGGVDFHKKMKAAAMEDELMPQLSKHRCLLVLEDVSTVVEWDTIRMHLPVSSKGSRIVVSTNKLGVALSCTGEPYQVSELRGSSDGPSLSAFFNKVPGRRSDMDVLSWQLRRRGVISVWDGEGKSSLVNKVYTRIAHKSEEFEGIEFERHNWVDVPEPFNLNVFYLHLLLNFHSVDLRAKEIAAVGKVGDTSVIQACHKFLREADCLVVINGLECTGDWDLIKDAFSSGSTKGCTVVVTKGYSSGAKSVARHCVDEEDRALDIKDMEADVVLRHLIKGCENYYGIEDQEASRMGHFFSNRRQEARDWTNKFQNVEHRSLMSFQLWDCLGAPGVISLWGPAGPAKSALVRRTYYSQMLIIHGSDDINPDIYSEDLKFTMYSWVDVPHPFDLEDFAWRLLLDFHSDDFHAKETATIGMMEAQINPIEVCRKFLRQDKCFVVIDGLRSTYDWDLIKAAFLHEPTQSHIIVITNEETVAKHCVEKEDRVLNVKGLEADDAPRRPLIKDCEYYGYRGKQTSRFFCNRREEACHWVNTLLVGREQELHRWLYDTINPVWGIAGVGKSALVRKLYHEEMLSYRYYTCTMYSWVDVPHPFNLTELSWRLLLDFHSDDLQAKESAAIRLMEGQDLIQECRKILLQDKCLVVLDGLRSIDDWDLIRAALLSEEPTESSIVVITNQASVATHCADNKYQPRNVKGLEPDAALRLFKKIAWCDKELTSEEKTFSELTVAKCSGLPKVIVAVGKYAAERIADMEEYPGRWTLTDITGDIHDDFMRKLETEFRFHSLRGLFSWMQSYFEDCPDSLKPCIFYLPVLPAGHNVRRKRLLRRWIAEGYSRDKFGSTTEEDGEMLFSELVKLSIIQPIESKVSILKKKKSKVSECQVNGFFHGYIMSRPMEDNLVFALEGRCSPNSQHTGQHLTIRKTWDRDMIVFESIDLTRLRSLTVFGEWRSFFVSVNMRLLRVLDLEDTSGVTDDDLEQIGKLLGRLKFLSLRGCKDITRLPNSLGCMRQLQTLDVKHTSIVTLPPAVIKLQKLQYIRAGPWNEGEDTVVASTDDPSTTSTPPEAGGDANIPKQAAATPSEAGGDANIPKQAAATPSEAGGDASIPKQAAATPSEAGGDASIPTTTTTATPLPEVGGDGTVVSAGDQLRKSTWSTRARDLWVSIWFSRRRLQKSGVDVPAGIGKLTSLRTLGVVDVSGAGGKAILGELKKLTQLRKLRVSGINGQNWQDFCYAISGHGYLESLSARVDEGVFGRLDDISEPPKTLNSLNLHGGNLHVSPFWMKQLRNLSKVHFPDLELTISTQEDIDSLMELPCQNEFRRLRVKPIRDGQLCYGRWEDWWCGDGFQAPVLAIDCRCRRLELVFGEWIPSDVEVLVIQCSSGSCLELSGLHELYKLKEVWLKGSYSDAVKQHLEQKLAEHSKTPVLRLEEEPATQSHKSKRPTAAC